MPRQFAESITAEDYLHWAQNCFSHMVLSKNVVDAAIWEEAMYGHLINWAKLDYEQTRRSIISEPTETEVECC